MRKNSPFPPELMILTNRMADLRTLFNLENDRLSPNKIKLRNILFHLRQLELDVDGFRPARV